MTASEAGRLDGQRGRRQLSTETARAMVCVREARKAFRKHQLRCFWWPRADLIIRLQDVSWVADGLRKNGGREEWRLAARLERLLTASA